MVILLQVKFGCFTMYLKMMCLDHFKMQGYLKLRKMQLKMTRNVNEMCLKMTLTNSNQSMGSGQGNA